MAQRNQHRRHDRRPPSRPPTRARSRRETAAVHRRRRLTAVALLVGAVVAVAIAAVNLSGGGLHLGVTKSQATTPPTTPSTTTGTDTSTQKPKRPQPAPAAKAGTYEVATTSLTLNEPAAPSIATGQTPSGESVRTLPTVIRYPKSKTASKVQGAPAPDYRFPLVVFSQGFDISASAYSKLLNAWASAGYVVAAPTYPKTDPSAGPVYEPDMANHPADLRFVISSLTAAAKQRGNLLHKLVNRRRVAIIGHSDGGDVSLAVAANSCCQDPVVKAAVILSGAEWSGFGGTYYSGGGSPPLFVAQGDIDTVNVLSCSAQLYDQAPQPKYYLDIPKAGHQEPYLDPGPWRTGVVRSVVAFLNAYLKHTPSPLNALVGSGHLPGGETLTTAQTVSGEPNVGCLGAP